MRMKAYQKLTLITVILGLIIPLFGLFLYFFVNSLIGIPLLGLVFGGALLIAILIIIINVAGLLLMACGVALFLVIHFFAIPGLVLFVISGILALRERNSTIKKV
jgi:hypothetical protein